MKQVLKKPIKDRSEQEQNKLAEIMLEVPYFKKRSDLKQEDLRALINLMKFESFNSL